MEKQTMGKFIATLRKANGMTQSDLAQKLSVSNKSVSKWECDDGYPDLSLIPIIAEIFSVTSDEILKGARVICGDNAIPEQPKSEKQVNMLLQKTLIKFKRNGLYTFGHLLLPTIYIFTYIAKMLLTDKKYFDLDEQAEVTIKLKKNNIKFAIVVGIVLLILFVGFVLTLSGVLLTLFGTMNRCWIILFEYSSILLFATALIGLIFISDRKKLLKNHSKL